MAKLLGPLFSVSSTGSVGSVLTFGKHGGAQCARRTPSGASRASPASIPVRNRYRVANALVWHCSRATAVRPETGLPDRAYIAWLAGSLLTWNTFFTQQLLTRSAPSFSDLETEWSALSITQRLQWQADAALADPPFLPLLLDSVEPSNRPVFSQGELAYFYASMFPPVAPSALDPIWSHFDRAYNDDGIPRRDAPGYSWYYGAFGSADFLPFAPFRFNVASRGIGDYEIGFFDGNFGAFIPSYRNLFFSFYVDGLTSLYLGSFGNYDYIGEFPGDGLFTIDYNPSSTLVSLLVDGFPAGSRTLTYTPAVARPVCLLAEPDTDGLSRLDFDQS